MTDVYDRLGEIYTGSQLSLVEKAYEFAKNAHEGQKRASGEPYFSHPCAVANI